MKYKAKSAHALRSILFGVLQLCLTANALALDFGTKGETFEIQEGSIIEQFIQSAADVDWNKLATAKQERFSSFLRDLPPSELPKAKRTASHYFDPSVIASQDYIVPNFVEKHDGSHSIEWVVAARKGDKFNPLEQGLIPVTRMLFFNPNNMEERNFAIAAWKLLPNNVILVVTTGNLQALSKELESPVFYAYPWLIDQLQIRQTPSLVGVGRGDRLTQIAVTEIAKDDISEPDVYATLQQLWYGSPN